MEKEIPDQSPELAAKKAADRVKAWLSETSKAKEREKKYVKSAREVVAIYEGGKKRDFQFNILYSNTEVLSPALYNVTPAVISARSTVGPGASPWTYQNTAARPQLIIVTGGTVSAIAYSRDNITFDTVGTAIGGQFDVAPGDYLKITYTVAPTFAVYPI